MNKAAIIGIIIVIAIVIGVVSSMSSMEKIGDEVLLTDKELVLDEIIPEEDLAEEPETTGKSITVELSESMGFKTP
jgi:uncharacterized membrane protein YagU involved in acid resistance